MNEKIKVVKNFIMRRYFSVFKSREKLERFQEKNILAQLKYIKAHSEYFRDIKADSADDLKALPYMDKHVMMENFNRLNCVGIDRDKALEIAINGEKTRDFDEKLDGISVGLSSGTSGARGLFIISDDERAMWAGGVLARFLPKGNIFGHKIAFFLRADNNLYETIDSKAIQFRYFDILKSMDGNLKELNEYQPSILVAPPSVLLLIASAMEKGEINVKPVKIVSVAEVLTENDEKYFKRIFGLDIIHQAYQCTEGFLGYVCECGRFHLSEDVIYVEREYIDDERFVPIITDFTRKSQPIIRYRLNDILVADKEKCPCGSACAVIKKIEGREDDIFIFDGPDGKDVTVFPDFISRCIIYAEGVRNYKVVQEDRKNITVYLDVTGDEIRNRITEEFRTLSGRMGFEMPEIRFEDYTYDPARKMKRVERKVR